MDHIEERLAEEARTFFAHLQLIVEGIQRHPPTDGELRKVHDCVEATAWPHSNAVVEA